MGKIYYDDVKKNDYFHLERLIYSTCNFRKISKYSYISMRLAKYYLYSCMTRQTYVRVARINGRAIGVIIARCEKDSVFRPKETFLKMVVYLQLMATGEGRHSLKLYREYNKQSDIMPKCVRKRYNGELIFFAVDRHYQYMGIGTHLLNNLHDYMRRQRVKRMYVSTDSGCNYYFYSTHKFSRVREKKIIHPAARRHLTVYIYKFNYSKRRTGFDFTQPSLYASHPQICSQ